MTVLYFISICMSQVMKWAAGSMESVLWSCVLRYTWSGDVLTLMQCSKGLRELLTYEIVFQSVLLRGGNSGYSRKTLESIMNLTRSGKIYIPSPMRILRLCCGKRCESIGCSNRVPSVQADFGIFLCKDCLNNMIVHISNYVSNIRTAIRVEKMEKKFVLNKDFYDVGGDRIGPVVTLEAIQRYAESENIYIGNGSLGFFTQLCESAPIISQEILRQYDEIRQRSKEFHQNRALAKKEAADARSKKKLLQFENIKQQILSLLREFPWASLAMKSKFLAGRLWRYQDSPSSANKKAIQAIALECIACFSAITKSGFLESGAQFLASPPAEEEGNILKTVLYKYCLQKKLTPENIVKNADSSFKLDVIVKLAQQGDFYTYAIRTFSLEDVFLSTYNDLGSNRVKLARQVWKKENQPHLNPFFGHSFGIIRRDVISENLMRIQIKFAETSRQVKEVLPIMEEYLSCNWLSAAQSKKLEGVSSFKRMSRMEYHITLDDLQNRYCT